MLCPKCSQKISDDNSFCPLCGTRVRGMTPQSGGSTERGPLEAPVDAGTSEGEDQVIGGKRKRRARKPLWCRRCGGAVDRKTYVCAVCGAKRRAIHFPKLSWKRAAAMGGCLLLAGGIVTGGVLQQRKIAALNEELEDKGKAIEILTAAVRDKDKAIDTFKTAVDKMENTIRDLRIEIDDMEDWIIKGENNERKAKFLDTHIVFVCDNYDSAYYHTYDCRIFQQCTTYWVYPLNNWLLKEYRPCPLCH